MVSSFIRKGGIMEKTNETKVIVLGGLGELEKICIV